jgi:homoserine dehydrogenase
MAIKRKTSRTKTAPASRKTTLVCAAASACAAAPVKIALLGFGTVGSSVARVLASSKLSDIELTHIFNRNVERKRASDAAKCVPESVVWTENFDEILSSGAEIVVELVGGLDPAEGWLKKCFAAGKSVVTANKQLIAYRGAALSRLAAKHGVQLVHGDGRGIRRGAGRRAGSGLCGGQSVGRRGWLGRARQAMHSVAHRAARGA